MKRQKDVYPIHKIATRDTVRSYQSWDTLTSRLSGKEELDTNRL